MPIISSPYAHAKFLRLLALPCSTSASLCILSPTSHTSRTSMPPSPSTSHHPSDLSIHSSYPILVLIINLLPHHPLPSFLLPYLHTSSHTYTYCDPPTHHLLTYTRHLLH
ncbi:hypothetical protein GGR58DRAFT_258007 [Xylaria digitata]|nr:hypothetical protein GGR58DRAFT_258007 [Xylaria digitata]